MGNLFKGQGKSGMTGSTVKATVNKNKNTTEDGAITRYAQSPKGSGGEKGDLSAPMVGSPNPSYKPTMTPFPDYPGRPAQEN